MPVVVVTEAYVIEQLDKLFDAFGLNPFTAEQASKTLNVKHGRVKRILQESRNVLKRLWVPRETTKGGATQYYTFNTKLDAFEILERQDPIPLEKRTLDVQLVGEDARRFEEIKRYRDYGILPPIPNRPLDLWETEVFVRRRHYKPTYHGED